MIELIQTSEYIVAKDHPKFTDIKNRAAISMHGLHLIGHEADGKHASRLYAGVGEENTFTGNGTYPRIITLTNTALTPKIVLAWEAPNVDPLVTNGGFDSVTTGWTAIDCSAASVAGGQTGNCLEITQGSTNIITNGGFETDMTGWTYAGTMIGGVAGGQTGNCCQATNSVSCFQLCSGHCPRAPYQSKIYGKCVDAALLAAGQQYYLDGKAVTLTNAWAQGQADVGHFSTGGECYPELVVYVSISGTHYTFYDRFAAVAGGGVTQSLLVAYNKTYNLSFYVKSGTSGNEAFRVGIYCELFTAGTTYAYAEVDGVTSAAWVQYSTSFTVTVSPIADTVTLALIKNSMTTGTMLFDTIVVTEVPGNIPLRIDTCPSTISNRADLTATGELTSLVEGSFTIASVGTAQNLNVNGRENYYCVLGIDDVTTYPGDTGIGTDPDWVEDDEQMLGGAVGTEPANKVMQHIYDLFVEEHTSAGEHVTDPFYSLMTVETGTATGTGSEQTVTMEHETTTLKEVLIFDLVTGDDTYTALDTMTMPESKQEDDDAFVSGMVQSIGTGEFSFIGTASRPYYWYAIGVQL
jgi:hypothetical protein